MIGFGPNCPIPIRAQRLHKQCDNMKIKSLPPDVTLDALRSTLSSSDVILDAIFGFSFKGPVRAPFDEVLPLISSSKKPIVSVDIPSGWDVENGNEAGVGLVPDVLLSLTAPKEGVRPFKGRHFLGGRFVPKLAFISYFSLDWDFHIDHRAMEERFKLNLPEYPGFEQIVELPQEQEPQRL